MLVATVKQQKRINKTSKDWNKIKRQESTLAQCKPQTNLMSCPLMASSSGQMQQRKMQQLQPVED